MTGSEAGLAPFDIKVIEPWVTLDVGGKSINFLIDAGATYCVFIQHSGPTCIYTLQLLA